MTISLRFGMPVDLPALAQMNRRLIEDEGSRNLMSLEQLQARLGGWLSGEQGEWLVRLFEEQGAAIGYAMSQGRSDEGPRRCDERHSRSGRSSLAHAARQR